MPEAMPPSSEESSSAVCNNGDPLCTIPTKMALESHSSRDRLRRPKRSVVNFGLPKQMVSPRERLTLVKMFPLAMEESFSEVTIRTSRGKACCKSPFLACQLSVFSTLARTGWSRSCVPVPRWSCELQSTRCYSPMSSGLILKMNMCYKWVSRELKSSRGEGGHGSRTPCVKGRGSFIDRATVR
jgi:hypothetical protein